MRLASLAGGIHVAALFVLALAAGCSRNDPAASWWNTPLPSSPSPGIAVLDVVVSPRALEGGETGVGTVNLTAAVTSATTVTLEYTESSVDGPRSVSIPAGASSATFSIGSRSVAVDVTATVTAGIAGNGRSTSLTILSSPENSFWYDIEPRGLFRHYTAPAASFFASCTGSTFNLGVDNDWSLLFAAPSEQPLRTGAFENVAFGANDRSPGLFVFSTQSSIPSCLTFDAIRRYVITELNLPARGPVRRFVGSFEERCRDGSATIRGAIRLLNPSPTVVPAPSFQGCQQ